MGTLGVLTALLAGSSPCAPSVVCAGGRRPGLGVHLDVAVGRSLGGTAGPSAAHPCATLPACVSAVHAAAAADMSFPWRCCILAPPRFTSSPSPFDPPLSAPPNLALTPDMLRLRACRVPAQTWPADAQAPVPAAALRFWRRCGVGAGVRAAAGSTMARRWRRRRQRRRRRGRGPRRGAPVHHHRHPGFLAGPPPAASPCGRPRGGGGTVDNDAAAAPAAAAAVCGVPRGAAARPAATGESAAGGTRAGRWLWRHRLARGGGERL